MTTAPRDVLQDVWFDVHTGRCRASTIRAQLAALAF